MKSNLDTVRPIRRILLECTDTYFTDWNTGIQRVVRNVARECEAIGREYGVECKPIVRVGDRFLALPWTPRIGRPETCWQRFAAHWWPTQDAWNNRVYLRLARRCGIRMRKLFYPRSVVRKLTHMRWSMKGETVIPGEGDTLVLLDAWWNRNNWPAVAQARHQGAAVGVVMYDLLPVTRPEFFKANVTEPFTVALQIALEQGDYFIAISDAVRDTLRDYAQQHGPRRRIPGASFLSFRLGSTLDMIHRNGRIRDSLQQAFSTAAGQAPYLTVGTIEPRKNHALLLDAFDQIWQRFPHAGLCIVGRIGWLCDDLVQRVVRHPQFGRSLFMFNNLSDSELAYCYQHAKGLIFPSHAEGFGLPVVEALQHGLHVLVSDIPIHREVGRDFCTYFDPTSPTALAELVCQVEATGEFPQVRQPDEYALPSWTDSTREFLGKCLFACGRNSKLAPAAYKAA